MPRDWKGPDDKELTEATKEHQEEEGQEPDSSSKFSSAQHQFNNDYQDEGEPFGPMSNRDRSTKEDVPSKEEDKSGSDEGDSDDGGESDSSSDGDGDSGDSGDGGDGGGEGGE
jgi:hypothetical protein